MRSRALMGKWYWQRGQTFRFSSSSLSKTMVLHLGHLVHRPSGISRFLDLAEPSFFLANVVAVVGAGGGVTAGSAVSKPSVFLVNEVVAISQQFKLLRDFEQVTCWAARGHGRRSRRRLPAHRLHAGFSRRHWSWLRL